MWAGWAALGGVAVLWAWNLNRPFVPGPENREEAAGSSHVLAQQNPETAPGPKKPRADLDGADPGLLPETGEEAWAPVEDLEYSSLATGVLCRQWIARLRLGESPEAVAIASELVRRGDGAVGEVERWLHSGVPAAETAAVRLLARIGTPRAVAAAIVRLCQEPESDAQGDLVKAFGNVRSRAVADVVVDMAAREDRPEHRHNLAAVLAAMEGSEVVEALAERIRMEDGEEGLRPWLDALGCLSRPSNVPGLERLLLDDPRKPVQAAAAMALAGIGDSRACWILAGFGADLPHCREALAQVRSPYAQETLRSIAIGDKVPEVRAAAQRALQQNE
jgi:HEAT repeat protein